MPSVFDHFKRATRSVSPVSGVKGVSFRLDFDAYGAFLDVVDAKGRTLEQTVDYRHYEGAERDLLRVIAAVREETAFVVTWDERNASRLYLDEHEELLWLLRRVAALVDAKGRPLRFVEEPAELVMRFTGLDPAAERGEIVADDTPSGEAGEATDVRSRMVLRHGGKTYSRLKYVTERFWLAGDTLYEVPALGEHARALLLFNTTVPPGTLGRLLTLLFSYVPDVPVELPGFEVVDGPVRTARPTLFFEKVDAEQTLFLRVAAATPDEDPVLFSEYAVTALAAVHPADRTVTRYPVTYEPLDDALRDVRGRLLRSQRNLDTGDDTFYEEGSLFIIGRDLAHAFLRDHLTALIAAYPLYGAEHLKAYHVRAVTPALQLRLEHGIDFLEGDAALAIDGETFGLFEALQLFRRQGYVALSDGTQAIVNRTYLDRLERLFKKKQDRVQLSFFDLPLVEELLDERAAEATLPKARAVFEGFNTLHAADVPPPPVTATLRPYQVFGHKWLRYLHEQNLGGCLADEMGLGKTLQTIAVLADVYGRDPSPEAPSLVVLPRSLLFNWANELDRFAPQLRHHTYYGPDRDFAAARTAQVVLTTYDVVRLDVETLKDARFHYVVLDEAQRIKNLASQTTKAVLLLHAAHRLALSGTPVQNHLGELYALFRFLNPAMFGSEQQFAQHYAQPVQRDGDEAVAHELRRKIYPFVLRRLKHDVAKDLPPRIDQTLYVDLDAEQAALYEQRRRYFYESVRERVARDGLGRSQIFILQALSELRQIATIPEALTEGRVRSAKRELLVEELVDLTANHRKALVFTGFLHAVETLAADLEAAGLGYLTMTGATQDRQALVERFQHDAAIHVFLMTLKTGGLGLNLTAADTVFLYDPWWNPAAEDQAIDRTHRIGQTSTVFSYRLIARGTIEEKMTELQAQKRALFDQVIAADRTALKALSEEDLDFIFG